MCYVNKMTNTKEVIDIFLNSKITNISDPENYSISELGGITNNSFKAVSYTHLTLPTNREV